MRTHPHISQRFTFPGKSRVILFWLSDFHVVPRSIETDVPLLIAGKYLLASSSGDQVNSARILVITAGRARFEPRGSDGEELDISL